MKRLVAVGLFSLVVAGGCGPKAPPVAPQVETPAGRAQVRQCLEQYDTCTLPCWVMRSNACVHQCQATLGQCYGAVDKGGKE